MEFIPNPIINYALQLVGEKNVIIILTAASGKCLLSTFVHFRQG
jgi:hypothetical protein